MPPPVLGGLGHWEKVSDTVCHPQELVLLSATSEQSWRQH